MKFFNILTLSIYQGYVWYYAFIKNYVIVMFSLLNEQVKYTMAIQLFNIINEVGHQYNWLRLKLHGMDSNRYG